jgi:hypothetical protein
MEYPFRICFFFRGVLPVKNRTFIIWNVYGNQFGKEDGCLSGLNLSWHCADPRITVGITNLGQKRKMNVGPSTVQDWFIPVLTLFHKPEVWSKNILKSFKDYDNSTERTFGNSFPALFPGIVDMCQNMCIGGYSTLNTSMSQKVTYEVFAWQTRIGAIIHDVPCNNFVNIYSWNLDFSRPWLFLFFSWNKLYEWTIKFVTFSSSEVS